MALSGQETNGDEPTSRSATTSHVHRPAAAESRDTGRVHPKVCVFKGWRMIHLNRPSATWVRLTGGTDDDRPRFIRDSTARRVSADRLLGLEPGTKYPRTDRNGDRITNDVLLHEGFVKVFDSGTRTYGWRTEWM